MSASPPANEIRFGKYAAPLLALLIAAGLAGNYFKFYILNLHFIFGSIFAMLALQLFGLGRGIFAAAVISSYTYLIWNHPYAIITMTGEVAVVGWLMRRRRFNLLTADTLYWLFIGIPVGYFCFHFISHLPVSNALFLMTKQMMNGIANALVARLIFTLYALYSRSPLISFREIVSNLLAFFVLCSTLIMLMVSSWTDFAATDRSIRTSVLQECRHLADSLEIWARDRKLTVANLAGMATKFSAIQMQAHLEQARTSDTGFRRMMLIDKEATIIACSPLVDKQDHCSIGKSFTDRPYIAVLKKTLKPMLSGVFGSKFDRTDPIAMMLAPVISDGAYSGAVGGILNLDQVKSILEMSYGGRNILYTLLDKNGAVVVTNRKDQKPMTRYSRGKGMLTRHPDGVLQWVPMLPLNISTIELWGRSRYVAESDICGKAKWKLVLEQPVAPFQKMLYDRYIEKLTLLLLIMIFSLVIADLLSRGVVKSNEKLHSITRDLPARLASGAKIEWPDSGIQDNKNLIDNFKKMADSLTARFKEIQQINELLEKRVQARTQELQASEEQLANAMEMAYLGHWEYDVTKDFFTFNDHFYKIFGTTAEQVGGYTMSSAEYARRFVHPDDQHRVREETQKAIRTDDPHYSRQLEHRMLYADGTVGYISVRFFIIKDAQGRTVKTYGVNQDITERKQIEARLQQSQKMEAIGTLAGGIAHDFNNILFPLIGFAEMLKEDLPADSPLQSHIEEILHAALRSKDLVKQILTFSRQSDQEIRPVKLQPVIKEALRLLRSLIPATIDIQQNIDPGCGVVVADPSQIHQIVMNLATNAYHAMDDTGGRLNLKLKQIRLDPDQSVMPELIPGEYALLTVADTGIGIEKDLLNKVFDPYFTTKPNGKGTGLGLSVVQGIVKSCNGDIRIYSEPGRGTEIHVYLPIMERGAEKKRVDEVKPVLGGTERILLIDDEEAIVRMEQQMLERLGYHVTVRTGSVEAFEAFKANPDAFDLVVTDMTMPNMTGIQLAKKVKNIRPETPVIICTGFSDQINEEKCLALGIQGYVMKPVIKREIADIIRKVLDQSEKLIKEPRYLFF